MGGNVDNPYTRAPLFETSEGLEEILNHPGLTASERVQLRERLISPLLPKETRVITQYPDIYASIYTVGIRCRGDYTEHFTEASEAIGRFNVSMQALPSADRETFMELKMGSNTLASSLADIVNNCIHAMGSRFLMLYMHYWHLLLPDLRPPMPPGAIQLDNDADLPQDARECAKLIIYFINDTCRVGIFIFDQLANGLYNYYGECLVIDGTRIASILRMTALDSKLPAMYRKKYADIFASVVMKYKQLGSVLYNIGVTVRDS